MKALLVDNVLLERTGTGFQVELQPHLGLISLIATLRGLGHVAELYDPKVGLADGELRLGPQFSAAVAEALLARDPDVVGFTSLGCNFLATLKIAEAVRRARPSLPILLGGPHASIVDREILERWSGFDVIVRGEAEPTIGPIFDALEGARSFDTVDGLTYRRDGVVVRTPDTGPILDLDALPAAAYDAYPIGRLGLHSLDIDAGRGCPFSCSFCSTAGFFGRRYRIKSARRLVAELDALSERYGIRTFNLTHDLFTVNKQSVREFCAAVGARGYAWTCSARIDCVDDALLAQMREAGCAAIYFGVETGSQRLQRVIDKRLDLALFRPVVRSSLALGLKTTVSFMLGFPAETQTDRDLTFELIKESVEAHPAGLALQLHLLAPEPGTALFAQHAGSLTYDGYISDFNFPLLENGDAAIITSDNVTFACHHYYADGGHRDDDIALSTAFQSLYALGHAFVAELVRRYGETFANLLRDLATFMRGTPDAARALHEFMRQRWGAGDPFDDIGRYLAAAGRLRAATQLTAQTRPGDHPLASCAAVIGECRDGGELLRRIQCGEALHSEKLERAPRLMIAVDADASVPAMYAIDARTYDVALALSRSASRAELSAKFDPAELSRRLWVLESLGVLAPRGEDASDGPLIHRLVAS